MNLQPRQIRFAIVCLLWIFSAALWAQDEVPTADEIAAEVAGGATGQTKEVEVADTVQVDPVNSDEKIARRLEEIMEATGWFSDPSVKVDRGVAFLSGSTQSSKHQQWAEATAMKTSDVVAVVNRIKVADQPLWNFAPAMESLKQLGREATSILPLAIVACLVGAIAYYLARVGAAFTRFATRKSIHSTLLRQVTSNVVAVLIFIVGVFIALRVSGLTYFAATLLGGTGLVGLALGFAFRDIAENYLASILLSLNHPFSVGDLIEVEGTTGYVRKVTTRGTILNTFEGNQVQLPNSTVYKGKITNFTATPLCRKDFVVGIGFDAPIVDAQEITMKILRQHASVVDEPAPTVVVESLGSATVNLRVFYWLDQTKHSALKVSSSIIRQVKQSLTEAKITMPDEARELVFPHGVPVQMLEATQTPPKPKPIETDKRIANDRTEVSEGEGDLKCEKDEVTRVTEESDEAAAENNLIA